MHGFQWPRQVLRNHERKSKQYIACTNKMLCLEIRKEMILVAICLKNAWPEIEASSLLPYRPWSEMSNMCCDQYSWMNTYCYVLQLGIVGGRLLPLLWIYKSAKIICTKAACMQVPDVMHVPWRTKYGHKDSCHHNKFYKTWIISDSVIWHTHSIYEYDHVPAIIVLTSCKAHSKKYLVKMIASARLLQFQGSLNRWVV